MKIPHLKREGIFRPQIRQPVKKLKTSNVVCVSLRPIGGYSGDVRVKIVSTQEGEFETSAELRDWTRFPARIRAAATELRDQGFRGIFQISHNDGCLEIKRLPVGQGIQAPLSPITNFPRSTV